MMLMQSMFYIGCVAVECQSKSDLLNYSWIKDKHSYERKNSAVVSVNRHQLQGTSPLTP